jgi:hypothetical protein
MPWFFVSRWTVGKFAYLKSQVWYILEGDWTNFVHFMAIWCILGYLVYLGTYLRYCGPLVIFVVIWNIFFTLWYVVPGKICPPCFVLQICVLIFFETKSRLVQNRAPRQQGCQMVYFETKNPNLVKIWRALKWTILLYFMTI